MYQPANVFVDTNVGAVLSSFIAFEVTDVVLQLPKLSQIFGLDKVHVDHDNSVLIVHQIFCDAGHTPASV